MVSDSECMIKCDVLNHLMCFIIFCVVQLNKYVVKYGVRYTNYLNYYVDNNW